MYVEGISSQSTDYLSIFLMVNFEENKILFIMDLLKYWIFQSMDMVNLFIYLDF